MIKIVYASRATGDPAEDDLIGLLEVARDRNAAADVTGMLVYAHGTFLQQLEGPDEAVDALWASIERDSRHTDIRLFGRSPARERRFAGWWMGFDHPRDLVLADTVPGFRASVQVPLINAGIITNGTVAETLLGLYAADRALPAR